MSQLPPAPGSSGNDRGALRISMRRRRAGVHRDAAAGAARAACARLLATAEFRASRRLAGYVAVRGELDPACVLHTAYAAGKEVFLPRIEPDGTLAFLLWSPATSLALNRFGIPEPELPVHESLDPARLDLVLVPLLAFDRRGTRLGSGAGYYDRSFEFKRGRPLATPLLAGFAFSFQERENLAAAEWDVALDLVVTEEGVIRTGAGTA